jgi:hypothetical protein
MQATKRLFAIFLTILLSAPAALPQELQRPQPAQEVQILLQPEQVRFTAPPTVEQLRLQIYGANGELIFDSQSLAVSQLTWLWQGADGQPVKSGMYSYVLTTKTTGATAEQVRRGHFIVDRAHERDAQADRVWLTSQTDTSVGTELTVSQNEAGTLASARKITERASTSGRDSTRPVEETEKTLKSSSEMVAAALAGTVGKLAKFTSATEVGDSVVTEAGGNLGIGTTSPRAGIRLHVEGSALFNIGNGGEVQFGTPNTETGMSIIRGGGRADLRFEGSAFKFVAGPAGGPPANENGIAVTTAGQVGIGTLTPTAGYKLQVNGNSLFDIGNGGNIAFGAPNSETGLSIIRCGGRGDLRFEGSALKLLAGPAGGPPGSERGVAVHTSGNVGIGTVNPETKLHVSGPGFVEATIHSQNERAILALSNTLSAGRYTWTLESGLFGTPGLFGIYNRNTQKAGLQIDGNLLVSVKALQITGGADLAENFDVRADQTTATKIQPGMVVTIDPATPGKLSLSRRAYDRRVAGIISGAGDVKPGMMMGQTGTLADGQHPVALTGRVYVWADATRGAIKPGDLLTTSATPGHAMKVSHSARAQGAILGKAMTALKSGKGLVLVLVTLQ